LPDEGFLAIESVVDPYELALTSSHKKLQLAFNPIFSQLNWYAGRF
jgi:hypothetical protein